MIFDPRFVTVGNNVIMGFHSCLIPHALEGENRLSHKAIRIGDNAVIGVNAVILGGVTVGEGAVIAAGTVVLKSTVIPRGNFGEACPPAVSPQSKNHADSGDPGRDVGVFGDDLGFIDPTAFSESAGPSAGPRR
ncbi:MAG: hypothetical protein IPN90_07795 [Elusimicrobia bacterium]|nr:hypothetical protein [Elusimicrobiota bacterium]